MNLFLFIASYFSIKSKTLVCITTILDRMNYRATLDKASQFIRQLRIDEALEQLILLVKFYPDDFELIQRIYKLAEKKPLSKAYRFICFHVFDLASSKPDFHPILLDVFIDYKKYYPEAHHPKDFSKTQIFNLFKHLAQSHLQQDALLFLKEIKTAFAEDMETPEALFGYCESMIQQRKFIRARDELKYLINYYAENPIAHHAISSLKRIEPQIL